MELYLMQHGLCLAKELDPEQSLSLVGRDQVEKCAHAARRMGLELDALVTSPKKRAQQTAAILSEAIRYPKKAIIVSELVKAMTPPQDTLAWLRELGAEREARRVGVVGHMPSLGELVSLLITPGSRAAIQIENAGLLRVDVLDFQRPAGTLIWYLGPQQLGLIGA